VIRWSEPNVEHPASETASISIAAPEQPRLKFILARSITG
jgi:hypothetical protein